MSFSDIILQAMPTCIHIAYKIGHIYITQKLVIYMSIGFTCQASEGKS